MPAGHNTNSSDKSDTKIVLVTGATGGVGRRVCHQLNDLGYELILVSRDIEKLHSLAKKLSEKSNLHHKCIALDFAEESSCASGLSEIRKSCPHIDGALIIYPSVPKSPDPLPEANLWRSTLDLCFINPLSVLRETLLKMNSGGRVVIISGIANTQVFPKLSFSNVIRTAWLAEAKTLSFSMGKRSIRINTISLGGTLTEQFANRLLLKKPNDVPSEDSPENIPLGEYGDPNDAASLSVAFLTNLANHVTGANIVFDGGLTKTY